MENKTFPVISSEIANPNIWLLCKSSHFKPTLKNRSCAKLYNISKFLFANFKQDVKISCY